MKFINPRALARFFNPRAIMRVCANVAVAAVLTLALTAIPEVAFAQASTTDPFANATKGADTFRKSLTSFALVVGGIGMVGCLMLGFFGKLNWKWVGTGMGVSFGLAVVPQAIGWIANLANASN
jgi:hypothetical protein